MRWLDRLGGFLAAMFLARPSLELANRTVLPSRVFRRADRTRAERMRSFGDRRLRRLQGVARREAAERKLRGSWSTPGLDARLDLARKPARSLPIPYRLSWDGYLTSTVR